MTRILQRVREWLCGFFHFGHYFDHCRSKHYESCCYCGARRKP